MLRFAEKSDDQKISDEIVTAILFNCDYFLIDVVAIKNIHLDFVAIMLFQSIKKILIKNRKTPLLHVLITMYICHANNKKANY